MPGGRVLAYIAAAGSLAIVGVMLFPGSPSMLVWPLEWIILGVLTLGGVGFWLGAADYRSGVSEDERARLILEQYAE